MIMSEILQLIVDNYASISIFLLALIPAAFLWRARTDLKELLSELGLDRLMLIVVFIFIMGFLIYPWLPKETDTYLILGLFAISATIPFLLSLSRFNTIKYGNMEFSGPRLDIRQADPKEIEEDKEKEEAVEEDEEEVRTSRDRDDGQKFEDIRKRMTERREKRRRIENKVLDLFSSETDFQKHAVLQLDEDADPIADIGQIIFDGSYRNWRRRYFIKILFSHTPPLAIRDRLYRDIRVMKDLTDGTRYRKYILKIAYIKLGEEVSSELKSLDFLKNYFSKAIRDEYLEIKVFNENGEEINA